jgi:hypothetical protein
METVSVSGSGSWSTAGIEALDRDDVHCTLIRRVTGLRDPAFRAGTVMFWVIDGASLDICQYWPRVQADAV